MLEKLKIIKDGNSQMLLLDDSSSPEMSHGYHGYLLALRTQEKMLKEKPLPYYWQDYWYVQIILN
jgi:hypothetical protein